MQLLDGEEDKLGRLIQNPTVDAVIVLIQCRNLLKVRHRTKEGHQRKTSDLPWCRVAWEWHNPWLLLIVVLPRL
jgi:hypothetical protein